VDLTSVALPVHDPLDTAKPDLPPSPLLAVATSDAKLRVCSLPPPSARSCHPLLCSQARWQYSAPNASDTLLANIARSDVVGLLGVWRMQQCNLVYGCPQLYTLSHLKRPLGGVVQTAERVPEIIPRQLSAAHSLEVPPPLLAAGQAAAPATDKDVSVAAAAQLPDSDEESLEGEAAQGSSREPDVSEAGRAQLPSSDDDETADESDAGSVTAAARAQLPESDEDSLTEDSDPEPGSPPAHGLDAHTSSEAAPAAAAAPQAGAAASQPASASTGAGGRPWRTPIGGPVHAFVSSALISWAEACSLCFLLNAACR
jgi:hypothetical protein